VQATSSGTASRIDSIENLQQHLHIFLEYTGRLKNKIGQNLNGKATDAAAALAMAIHLDAQTVDPNLPPNMLNVLMGVRETIASHLEELGQVIRQQSEQINTAVHESPISPPRALPRKNLPTSHGRSTAEYIQNAKESALLTRSERTAVIQDQTLPTPELMQDALKNVVVNQTDKRTSVEHIVHADAQKDPVVQSIALDVPAERSPVENLPGEISRLVLMYRNSLQPETNIFAESVIQDISFIG
jgi:hypothetical protein